ncbi:MAG TPA: hypothetical protein VF218_07655 [Acidothermaceae bacterium]
MAVENQREPSVSITLREIYDKVTRLEKYMWALPASVLASIGSLVAALR